MEKVYHKLDALANCEIVHKLEHGRVLFTIQKFLGKLKVTIKYQGNDLDAVKNEIEGILEQITGISSLLYKLQMQGHKIRHEKKDFLFSCELEGLYV